MALATEGKHEEFCIGIASGLTAENAYIQAGYSENGAAQSASRLLTNAKIQARVRTLRNAMAERAIERAALTRNYVIQGLMAIVEQCMQHEPIQDKFGNVVGYAPYRPMAAIRALELLGKELGMFAPPRAPLRTSEFATMTMEELEQREAEIDRRLEELERRPKPKRLRKS